MSARRRRFVERSSSALSLVRARLGRARGLGAAAGLLLGPGALDAARDGGAPALEEPGQRRVAIREARDASKAVAVPRRDLGKRRRRERFARPGVRDGVARADLEDRGGPPCSSGPARDVLTLAEPPAERLWSARMRSRCSLPSLVPAAVALCFTATGCLSAAQPAAPPPNAALRPPPSSTWLATQDGWMDLEDYVARVCTQENGAAAFEALKAQAVAARTYVLWAMRDEAPTGTPEKPIPNSQSFQTYAAVATPACSAATAQTRGLVLRFGGALVVASYVAGARLDDAGAVSSDPTHTEKWVTYNHGRAGAGVQKTPLLNTDRADNRGCMSQNGADWMARRGHDFVTILRFYYGEDVWITQR